MALRIAPAVRLLLSAAIAATGFPLTPAPAEPASVSLPPAVGVLLRFDGKPSADLVKQIRLQVEYIFRPAGLDLHWEMFDGEQRSGEYDEMVLIEMRGCTAPAASEPRQLPGPQVQLGWTFVTDGKVMSRLVVDCNAVAAVAGEARRLNLAGDLFARATFLRLLARVIGHEMLHALLATREHGNSSYTRAQLRAADLLAAPRLSADEVRRLHEALYDSPKRAPSSPP